MQILHHGDNQFVEDPLWNPGHGDVLPGLLGDMKRLQEANLSSRFARIRYYWWRHDKRQAAADWENDEHETKKKKKKKKKNRGQIKETFHPGASSVVERAFLQLMKPLGETSLLFVLCSSSLSHIYHSLNLLVSYKHGLQDLQLCTNSFTFFSHSRPEEELINIP